MTKEQLINKMVEDLHNEYWHFHFYLQSSILVNTLNRAELSEMFWENAQSELNHIKLFYNMIRGFNCIPQINFKPFPSLSDPNMIIEYALNMELEVVENYVERIKQAEELGGVDGKFVQVFYEDQLMDSRQDIDNLRLLINKY